MGAEDSWVGAATCRRPIEIAVNIKSGPCFECSGFDGVALVDSFVANDWIEWRSLRERLETRSIEYLLLNSRSPVFPLSDVTMRAEKSLNLKDRVGFRMIVSLAK